ncbi:TPA: hypothetical protein ACODJ0_003405, partial [Salmonella enterica subsp. enterica serovar Amsterdam]|nr:hypothetical protein [Salmonella enterica subsp. enterica serovar Berkeley]
IATSKQKKCNLAFFDFFNGIYTKNKSYASLLYTQHCNSDLFLFILTCLLLFGLSRLACFVCFLNGKKYLLFNADDPLNKKHLSLGF